LNAQVNWPRDELTGLVNRRHMNTLILAEQLASSAPTRR